MKLWGWIRHKLGRLLDKASQRFYEGPTPPHRYTQAAGAFAFFNDTATRQEWIEFSAKLAEDSYREGYVRGLEHAERTDDDPFAELEDKRKHDWNWVDLAPAEEELKQMVEDYPDVIDRMSPEQRMFLQDRIGREMGMYRIVLLPTQDPKER